MDNNLEITFVDDATWRSKVTDVKVDNISLTSEQFNISANVLTINQGVIQTVGVKKITIVANGYEDSIVDQMVNVGEVNESKSSVEHIDGDANVGGTPRYRLSAKDQYGNAIVGYQFGIKLSAVNNNHTINEKVDVSINGAVPITYIMPKTNVGIPAIVDVSFGTTDSNGELIVSIHYFGDGILGVDYDLHDGVGPLWFNSNGTQIFN